MTRETQHGNGTTTTERLAMGIELSARTWTLAFADTQRRAPRVVTVIAFDGEEIQAAVARAKKRFGLATASRVVSCHETGRDGFAAHRFLERLGIVSVPLDSSSIEVPRRQRRSKTDRLDAQRLVRLLLRLLEGERNVGSVVRVPTPAQEDERRLHRERERLVRERTRLSNRVGGLLAQVGVKRKLNTSLPSHLKSLVTAWETPLPPNLQREVLRVHALWTLVREQIAEIEAEQHRRVKVPASRADQMARQLMQLKSIGIQSGLLLAKEFFGWRTFANRRQVGAAAGLAGTPYNTGQSQREQGISKAGNRRVRSVMIELAWMWLRWQPGSELAQWWKKRFADGNSRMRRKGIVAVARKLLVLLWQYLEQGVVPPGAVMKTATK